MSELSLVHSLTGPGMSASLQGNTPVLPHACSAISPAVHSATAPTLSSAYAPWVKSSVDVSSLSRLFYTFLLPTSFRETQMHDWSSLIPATATGALRKRLRGRLSSTLKKRVFLHSHSVTSSVYGLFVAAVRERCVGA